MKHLHADKQSERTGAQRAIHAVGIKIQGRKPSIRAHRPSTRPKGGLSAPQVPIRAPGT